MTTPLMPKATAIWLIDNTTLTFEQIGAFCGLHPLEVQAIADGEAAAGLIAQDPVASGELSLDDIELCQASPLSRLTLIAKQPLGKTKSHSKYTPLFLRQAKPHAIAWLLREIPDIKDGDIIRLLGTTRATIQSIRLKTYRDMANLKPQSPVHLGLCQADNLNEIFHKYKESEPSVS